MTTTTLEAAPATVTKSDKKARGTTSPAPKAQLPKEVKAAAEAFAADVAKKTPAKQAVKKLAKAVAPKAAVALDSKEFAEHPATKANAASWGKVTPKAKPERKVSAMQVIRRTLAHNHAATVEEISAACTKAGVPKADGTIATIRSDFMQTYAALREAGCIKTN